MKYAQDITALLGLGILSGGVWMLFGLGWALLSMGSGLYLTAIYTHFMGVSSAAE